MMGEIGVHLEEDPVTAGIGQAFLEGGDHGRAPSPFLRALDELHSPGGRRPRGADGLPGAVGAAVVGHPHVDLLPLGEEIADERAHVLPLVVGGDHDQDPAPHPAPTVGWAVASRRAAATAWAWASLSSG